ncbi:MAG TPA: pyridoxamine 5'-phosphate oxidase family protein [Bacteroidales bacterium]|nr:pyridoxamine 5'-phosphate oxidase family protein [Lentimicrobiaceae bacterium]HOH99161.1 pyridoxamine 5'-phosphate oxidase family protein [Bacteroidales bacterium]
MRARTVTLKQAMDEIIRKCQYCHVSMVDGEGKPYGLPFNFGYDGEYIYLHSAPEGKKISILSQHPAVCVAFSTDHVLYHQSEKVACSYGMKYRSVLAYGEVEFIDNDDDKIPALNHIMRQYTGKADYSYNLPAVRNVKVYRVRISNMEARVFGY